MSKKTIKILLRVGSIIVFIASIMVFIYQWNQVNLINEEENKIGYKTVYVTIDEESTKNQISSLDTVKSIYPYYSLLLLERGLVDGVDFTMNGEMYDNTEFPACAVVSAYYPEDPYDQGTYMTSDLANYFEVIDSTSLEVKLLEDQEIGFKGHTFKINHLIDNYYSQIHHTSFVFLVPYQQLQPIFDQTNTYIVYPNDHVENSQLIKDISEISNNIIITQAENEIGEAYSNIKRNAIITMTVSLALAIGMLVFYFKMKRPD